MMQAGSRIQPRSCERHLGQSQRRSRRADDAFETGALHLVQERADTRPDVLHEAAFVGG
jgi:hypothetical protein